MTKNLWGDLPAGDEIVPPVAILKEQASHLSRMTGHVLNGEVDVEQERGNFVAHFAIRAPALDNYKYWVLTIKYPLEMYPVSVDSSPDTTRWKRCETQEEFEDALEEVFLSSRVRKAIAALHAQSKSV